MWRHRRERSLPVSVCHRYTGPVPEVIKRNDIWYTSRLFAYPFVSTVSITFLISLRSVPFPISDGSGMLHFNRTIHDPCYPDYPEFPRYRGRSTVDQHIRLIYHQLTTYGWETTGAELKPHTLLYLFLPSNLCSTRYLANLDLSYYFREDYSGLLISVCSLYRNLPINIIMSPPHYNVCMQ